MIVGYRDKRTADFAAGKRVKAFSGIERPLASSSIGLKPRTSFMI
jgi:hypothetical protein